MIHKDGARYLGYILGWDPQTRAPWYRWETILLL